MNLRKFYFIVSSVLFIFLITCGIFLLNQISQVSNSATPVISGFNEILKDFADTKVMNILVLGGDKVAGNTDTIMVVNYNPKTSKINVLSVPRDTMVEIDGRTRKINFAYPHAGEKLTMSTLKELLGIDINYFVYIDTKVFRDIIDELGGVEYDVPADMNYDDNAQNLHIHLKKGLQTLDGAHAEQFMRFRNERMRKGAEINKYYDGSDLKRIDAQQSFIKEVFRQKASIGNLTKVKDVLDTIFDEMKTNLELNDVIHLAQKAAGLSSDDVTYYKLAGEDKYIDKISYFVYNGKIQDNTTKEAQDANTVLNECFVTDSGYIDNVVNNPDEKENTSEKSTTPSTKKKSMKKNNPSNSSSSVKGTKKPGP